MRIKKGDTVKVIAGKDKGKTGTVLRTLPKEDRVVVEGLNIAKKHVKPSQAGSKNSQHQSTCLTLNSLILNQGKQHVWVIVSKTARKSVSRRNLTKPSNQ